MPAHLNKIDALALIRRLEQEIDKGVALVNELRAYVGLEGTVRVDSPATRFAARVEVYERPRVFARATR